MYSRKPLLRYFVAYYLAQLLKIILCTAFALLDAVSATYTHPESGVKYSWSVEKQMWISESGEMLYPSNSWDYSQK